MKIVLGICGSISCYKTYDLVRLFVKDGHEVKVILTSGAEKFIKAETFLYLGAKEVFSASDDFNTHKNNGGILHINLRDWMDKLIIAPLSANTLAKLANGFCDDLLGSLFIASNKTCITYPAMNTGMYENEIVKQNLIKLSSLKNVFVHKPASGILACGDEGLGKLPEIETIFHFSLTYNERENLRKILITTGSTAAPLDPIRYITNPSSGKTGFELTKKYLMQGCNVVLIYGHGHKFPDESLKEHPRLKLIKVKTTDEMYQRVDENFDKCDVYITSAAISDIKFTTEKNKIKKSDSNTSLNFEWATDILAEMIARKKDQTIISFAAETNNLKEQFYKKWKRKPVDLLIGNKVQGSMAGHAIGFGEDQNQYYFVRNGEVESENYLTKTELANRIYGFTEENNVQSH